MTTGAQRYYVRSPDGGPALLWAVARGKTDIAELLIAHGARVDARDAEGTSAIDLALEREKAALVEVLKRAGGLESSGDPEPTA